MTPQTNGTHVTGFVSCKRIFHFSCVPVDAPFTPNSCRTLELPSCASSFFAAKVIGDDEYRFTYAEEGDVTLVGGRVLVFSKGKNALHCESVGCGNMRNLDDASEW
jgi:hypothetical protein